jgi:hypothetical protein
MALRRDASISRKAESASLGYAVIYKNEIEKA